MYEESMRTPFIVRDPFAKTKNVKAKQLIQNIDWAPTILDYANAKIPNDFQGKSLKKIITEKETT